MVIEIIQKEVPTRGIGYIILRDCPEDRLGEALGKGMERLKKAGAKNVWATSLPEGEPLHPGPVGVWRLTHVHDMLELTLPLGPDRPRTEDRLLLKPAKRSNDEKLWIDLVNRALQSTPNAHTYVPADMRAQNHRCGLAWLGDKAVGAYELDLTEKTPQLATLAIDPEYQRQGLGKKLLLTVLDAMPKASACTVVTSTANEAAMKLAESIGFGQSGIVSSWFEVI